MVSGLVLLDGVLDGLVGGRRLQLDGDDRDAVDEQHHVDGLVRAGERHLAHHRQPVAVVELLHVGGKRGGGPVEGEPEGLPVVDDAVAEHAERALAFQLGDDALEECRAGLVAVEADVLGPGLGLGGLDEGEEVAGVEGEVGVVGVGRW